MFNLSFYPVNKARFIEYYARDVLLEIIALYAQKDTEACHYTPNVMTPDSLSSSTVSCSVTASVISINDSGDPIWFRLSKDYYYKLHSSMSTKVHFTTGSEIGNKSCELQNHQIDPAQEARAALVNLGHDR